MGKTRRPRTRSTTTPPPSISMDIELIPTTTDLPTQPTHPSSPHHSSNTLETPQPTTTTKLPATKPISSPIDVADNSGDGSPSDEESAKSSDPSAETGTAKKRKPTRSVSSTPAKRGRTTPLRSTDPISVLQHYKSRAIIPGMSIDFTWLKKSKGIDLLEIIKAQGWENLFGKLYKKAIHPRELAQFYANLSFSDDGAATLVNGVEIELTVDLLNEILGLPEGGYDEHAKSRTVLPSLDYIDLLDIVRKYSGNQLLDKPIPIPHDSLSPFQRALWNLIRRSIVPCAEGRNSCELLDLVYLELLENRKKVDFSSLMLKHMAFVKESGTHGLPYGPLITAILEYNSIPLSTVDAIKNAPPNIFNSGFLTSLHIKLDDGKFVSTVKKESAGDAGFALLAGKLKELEGNLCLKFQDVVTQVADLGTRVTGVELTMTTLAESVKAHMEVSTANTSSILKKLEEFDEPEGTPPTAAGERDPPVPAPAPTPALAQPSPSKPN